jgi:S1-C subfamily serine protease
VKQQLKIAFIAFFAFGCSFSQVVFGDFPDVIEKVKPSIVAVGTFKKTNSPQFVLRGTGFVISDGNHVATNAHVVPEALSSDDPVLAVQIRSINGSLQVRRAFLSKRDIEHDIAVLTIEGASLPVLTIANSDLVREGNPVGFTGFPIGGALGFSPVTHRGIVSSITPIALPSGNVQQLNEKLIHKLKNGVFNIFQLDATAYPGNSGSPVFNPESGEVIGVINMVFIKSTREAALSNPSGITYAIPVNFLTELLRQSELR